MGRKNNLSWVIYSFTSQSARLVSIETQRDQIRNRVSRTKFGTTKRELIKKPGLGLLAPTGGPPERFLPFQNLRYCTILY